MTITDPEQFIPKDKLVIYTLVFVEFHNWKNYKQVHEIHRIIKLKKLRILSAENLYNLDTHQIIKISSVIYSAHIISRD